MTDDPHNPPVIPLETPPLSVLGNLWTAADYEVQLFCAEFTCLCPFTHKPDFAELTITYVPDRYLVETRSLKVYLSAFRNVSLIQEFAVNQICADLARTLQPKKLIVKGEFAARGGVRITPTAHYNVSVKAA